ncbi:MAG: VWA domain-containing protein, partial [Gemmataceae bacterium]|nr:VWA domain-containing protein [Gemmataceae bacterium]
QDQPQTRIQVQVNEVIVPVTVTDDKGRFVSNLDKNDFRILDEGKEQAIRFFSRDQKQPVVVGFLVDLSNSTRLHWKNYQDAILELVWGLLPGDKKFSGYLIGYSNEAELMVNTTWDSDKIADKIRKAKPGGGAALYDAIYMACTTRELVKGEPYEPRRILIVIGDGHDNASKKSLEEVAELAQRNLVTVYAMSTIAYGFNSDGEKVLERLAQDTGGRVEYPLNSLYKDVSGYLSTPSDEGNYAYKVGTGGYAAEISKGIITAVTAIAGEVTTQDILRYIPDIPPDSKPRQFRNIKVEVPSLATQNIRIRARKGYYSQAIGPAASVAPPSTQP